MPNAWRCGGCGYRLDADVPPEECPSCHEKCGFIDANPYVPVEGGAASTPAPQPRVAAERCTGCLKCLPVCPVEAIEMHEGVAWIDPELCDGDGLCIPACPEGAIVLPKG